jgi:ketosteroid isomerase-like protein
MKPFEIVLAYIDRINAHDVDGLGALMEEEHVLIDGLGASVTGREVVRRAWRDYFEMVPDYWIRVERHFQHGPIVGVFGKAGGTVTADGGLDVANYWESPAAWQVVVGKTGIAVWQVFADNEPVRQILKRVGNKATAR